MPPTHLMHVFPTFGIGGVQNRIVRIMNALPQEYHHTIISLDADFAAASNLRTCANMTFESPALRKSGFISAVNLRTARSALRRLNPDMMLTYNWGSIEWVLANRYPKLCPHVHFESGFGPDENPDNQHWRRVVSRWALLSGCKFVVVPSVTLYRVATQHWHLSPKRVLYLPNGVDCSRFTSAPCRTVLSALGIPEGVTIIGAVAPLRPEKNIGRLIRAFAGLPAEIDARLVIAGDGNQRRVLEAAAACTHVRDRIVFVGHLQDPSRILGQFSLFALSSDTEQMPNAILEAMAAGLAVVTTDVGDVRLMLSAENAPFVVHAKDEGALTNAMLTLLRQPALARQIGRANREKAQAQFSFDMMLVGYERLYSGLEPMLQESSPKLGSGYPRDILPWPPRKTV